MKYDLLSHIGLLLIAMICYLRLEMPNIIIIIIIFIFCIGLPRDTFIRIGQGKLWDKLLYLFIFMLASATMPKIIFINSMAHLEFIVKFESMNHFQ